MLNDSVPDRSDEIILFSNSKLLTSADQSVGNLLGTEGAPILTIQNSCYYIPCLAYIFCIYTLYWGLGLSHLS